MVPQAKLHELIGQVSDMVCLLQAENSNKVIHTTGSKKNSFFMIWYIYSKKDEIQKIYSGAHML